MAAVNQTEHADAQRMWALYARSYDRVLPKLPYYRQAVRRHLDALAGAGSKNVLDLGCGTGNVALPLSERGVRVTAADLSAAMLAQLRSKLPGRDADSVRIIQQNAEHLRGLDDASFDAVTVLLVLYAVADQAAALAEAVRVLRPGGLLVITEPRRCFELQPLLDEGRRRLEQTGQFESLREDWRRVTTANAAFDPAAAAPLRAEDIHDRLREAGFGELSIVDSHLGLCATITGLKPGAA